MPQGLHLETNNKNMAWLDLAGDSMEDETKLHLKDHEWNECMVHSKYPVAMQIVQIAKNDELNGKVELMKLLLAASINSTEKQIYVEIIMGMEDEKQEQLMYVIQEFSEIAQPMDYDDDVAIF